MTFDALHRRINAYLKIAREKALVISRLPFVVMRAEWLDGKEVPDYHDMKALMAGKITLHDHPGYEEHNARSEETPSRGTIVPKLYLFDPEEEGADDRPSEEDDSL